LPITDDEEGDEEEAEELGPRESKGKGKGAKKTGGRLPSYFLVTSTLDQEKRTMLDDIASQLQSAEIMWEGQVDDDATHLVCGEKKRTEKVLQALAKGIWVLKWNWVIESMEAGKWLPEEKFEAADWFPGAKTARLARGTYRLLSQVLCLLAITDASACITTSQNKRRVACSRRSRS
jgi:hypothetical protein